MDRDLYDLLIFHKPGKQQIKILHFAKRVGVYSRRTTAIMLPTPTNKVGLN